ncbi:general secretion pathway protein G [Novimethylophilus kurashikiensis]|uniref:Type II secretion system core protein G n=1 Tax=Novimethylophilus kurashikiensis TaxID=1825523 RepID=A0A2R5FIL6_9PROT|nr:general secretion pathway protein G [Novimethylophilus kurashikiensis]
MKKSSSGFTLLELLVVMVIIGMLAGYVGPKYFSQIGKSELKAAKAQIDALEKALDQYRLDTGHYPSSEQGLAALNAKPASEPKWGGPYLKKTSLLIHGDALISIGRRASMENSTSSRTEK